MCGHLFLEIPSIAQKQPDSFDQSHQNEHSDQDKLVIVRQGRILLKKKGVGEIICNITLIGVS